MSEFNKDDYLNDLPDPSDTEAAGQAAQASSGADASAESGSAQDSAAQAPSNEGATRLLPQLRERSRMPERRLAKASPILKTPSPLSARPRRKPPTTSKPCSANARSSSTTAIVRRRSRSASVSTALSTC